MLEVSEWDLLLVGLYLMGTICRVEHNSSVSKWCEGFSLENRQVPRNEPLGNNLTYWHPGNCALSRAPQTIGVQEPMMPAM